MASKLTTGEIKRAISSSIPVIVKTYSLAHETEIYIERILEKFLQEIGYEKIKNPLAYCLKELAVNAKKANTKRVYFLDNGWDIANPSQYESGMSDFKEKTLSNIDYYVAKQKEAGLYIKIAFQTRDKAFIISVHNNVEITRDEHIRIFDRIARARAYENITDAFNTVIDNTEGAGLGIIILILMLKKIGLSEDAFEIDVENGETIARITIPLSEVHLEKISLLMETIVREVNSLPRFPDSIVYLQKLTSDPDASIQEIARHVSSDPVLTAELLKLVNSPIYRVAKRIESIAEAVKLVGMRGLRNLLYSYGTQKILGEKYTEMKDLWKHSLKVATYAHTIARNYTRKNEFIDDVFVAGILHDLGKIIFTSLHPDLLDKLIDFCNDKGIAINMLEDLSIGLNHAETGALMAEKWNFPEQLVEAIRRHHEPSTAPDQYVNIVYPVYLANFIANFEDKELTFPQLDPTIRRHYNFKSEEDFQNLVDRIIKITESSPN
ncbi:MAG: HDOD domain-containing protein [Spirochaetales bacterium]|nr:HDOD domain-containing protein [Spirochaetales bacterium]